MMTRLPPLVLMFLAFGAFSAQAASPDADFFQRSYEQEAAGKPGEALATLGHLSADRGNSYLAHLRRGWLHYQIGTYAPAVDAYAKAIALAPKAVEPRLGILLPLLAAKKWGEAERQGRELLRIDPRNYLATMRLAFALYNQNKLPESIALYKKAIEEFPGDMEPRVGLGWALLKAGNTADAQNAFATVLGYSPKNASATQGMAALAGK